MELPARQAVGYRIGRWGLLCMLRRKGDKSIKWHILLVKFQLVEEKVGKSLRKLQL